MKNQMKMRVFGILLFATVLFLMNTATATFTSSNPQVSSSTFSSQSFDNSVCQQGQDFIVQISPAGCTPAVVRSDLLEEQDVQVYCPLSATQINPLIDVNSIGSISFAGNYSQYVKSIGFYPAQAALNLQGQLNNYPLMSNIGYVVINLKQMPNESAMPNIVSGNLVAKMNYNAENVFGVGTANFYLPELSDADWESSYQDYGFWNGKGYVRTENIDGDKATIIVYDANLNQQGTTTLKQGETSSAFSVSGFSFCSGGAQVKLNALKNADTRVKLDVNGDLAEVSRGEYFLDNNCQVISTEEQGLVRNVRIACSTDSGKKTFDLKVAPQLVLNVNGENKTVSLGDYLYTVPGTYSLLSPNPHSGKSVFLGYIGSTTAEPDLQNLFVVLVALPKEVVQNQNALTASELTSIASWIQNRKLEWRTGISGIFNVLLNAGKVIVGTGESITRSIVNGEGYAVLPYDASLKTGIISTPSSFHYLIGDAVKIVNFAEGQDTDLDATAKQYYQSAVDDYQEILDSYQSETYPSDSKATLGEKALYEQITLANKLQQKFTLLNLCDDFRQKYPNSKEDITLCKDNSLLSSPAASTQSISINGHLYLISLKTVYQPTYEDYGAQIQVRYKDGSTNTSYMNKDGVAIINETSQEFMQLKSLTTTTATVSGNVKTFSSNTVTLKKDEPAVFSDYILTLVDVNLKQFAQVSVIPKTNKVGSSANFTFTIDIEKRAIQLSPDKVKDKLGELNKSISTLEDISNATSNVIKGLTAACEISGAFLTVKNFFENLGGAGTARQIIMRETGGWSSKCTDLVSSGKYVSLDQCFLQNADAIDADVSALTEIMQAQNTEISNIEQPYTTSSLLGEDVVNTDSFMQKYLTSNVQPSLNNLGSIANPNNPSESISTSEAKTLLDYSNWKNGNFDVTDARNIELYAAVLASSGASETLKNLAKQELYSTLKDIQVNSKTEILQETFGTETGLGENNVMIGSSKEQTEIPITQPKTFASSQYFAANPGLQYFGSNYTFGFKDASDGKEYIIIYEADGTVKGTYLIGGNNVLTAYTKGSGKTATAVVNPFNLRFRQYSATTYKNTFKDPKVQYFETEPYKGMPAIVPFDLQNGWYAAMKQTLAIGNNIQTYDASARVNSFYLCNVGQNGIQEFNSGIGDDICQSMNVGTNQPYDQFPGLDSDAASSLVKKAVAAIQEAAKAYQSGVSYVTINGQRIPVGTPAANIPGIQCQDFMSPDDCNLLFNLCDPVICPSSRCDFGGAYPVKDVQATGIIGSLLLCLPNMREGIIIPVCLTGVQTGLENWISVQKAYSDCLQESLDTGETTGICDEMNSIYMCDFFWQQAAPLASIAAPKITESLLGQTTHGGGEYMSVQNAFDTAKQSTDYLLNYYGAGSTQAFNIKSLDIGSAFCQNFTSFTMPSGADILDQVTAPDSPPQYTGTFEEISLTTATVPPTSQYKVYYHIYAGKNSGVYYSVYLQGSAGSSFYQDTSSILSIASGYIEAGGYADETIDKIASSGYAQLCINVNGQVECGFQQVSTSLAVDYLQDQYLADEINKNVTTESDCISGSANIYSILNPNIQNAVSDVINPELYNQGITRICATDNPGIGSDPYAESETSRWVEVGYCGDKNLKCWLDTKNIKDILDSPDLAAYLTNGTTTTLGNTTLDNVRDNYLSILLGTGYLTEDKFADVLKEIKSKENPNDKLTLISEVMSKIFYNNQKAYLLLLRGEAYGLLAVQNLPEAGTAPTSGTAGTSGTTGSASCSSAGGTPMITAACNSAGGKDLNIPSGTGLICCKLTTTSGAAPFSGITPVGNDFASPAFEYKDGRLAGNIYYKYYSGGWYWSSDRTNWRVISNYNELSGDNANFAKSLIGLSYEQGLKLLIDRTASDSGGFFGIIKPSLSVYYIGTDKNTYLTTMDSAKQFAFGYGVNNAPGYGSFLFKFSDGKWMWKDPVSSGQWIDAPTVTSGGELHGEPQDLIKSLDGKEFYSGAELIFNAGGGTAYQIKVMGDLYQIWDIWLTNLIYITYYTDQWKWSVDKTNWMTTTETIVKGGFWDGQSLSQSNKDLMSSLTGKNLAEGKAVLSRSALSSSSVDKYETYKSIFEKYSQKNFPSSVSTMSPEESFTQNDFKALLAAIADENDWDGSNGDWLMGYNAGEAGYQGADAQVAAVSGIFKFVLEEDLNPSSAYSKCPVSATIFNELHCALSVMHTGKTDAPGFFGIGANTEGNTYADSVLTAWGNWIDYFNF